MAEEKKYKKGDWFERFFGLDEASQRKDFDKFWDRPEMKAQFDSEEQWAYNKELEWKEKCGEAPKGTTVLPGVTEGLGRSGPKQVLVNSLGTDNLDALFHDCAPGLTQQANSTYQLTVSNAERLKVLYDKLDDSRYQELKGRYDELQKHYEKLEKERDTLVQALVENKKAGIQR